MDPRAHQILLEIPGHVRVYKTGRVQPLGRPAAGRTAAASASAAAAGVTFKDVVINPETGVSARLYLPLSRLSVVSPPEKRLPVIVYFHAGYFCTGSAASPVFHNHVTALVSRADAVALSVNYRLAPKHPLPAAYDDSWEALQWANTAAEPWLADHGDLARIFLVGDSAGGNIMHHLGLRAGAAPLPPGVGIEGVVLVHPLFWGSVPIGSEPTDPTVRSEMERMWAFLCPSTGGIDDPRINPTAETGMAGMAGERALVCVAGRDWMCGRGRSYYETLKRSGWAGVAELMTTPDEGHVFHLVDPGRPEALALMGRIVRFVRGDENGLNRSRPSQLSRL